MSDKENDTRYPKIIGDALEPGAISGNGPSPASYSINSPLQKKDTPTDELILIQGDKLLERWPWSDPTEILYCVLQGTLTMIDYLTGHPWTPKGGGMTKSYLNWISSRPVDKRKGHFSSLRFRIIDIEEFERKPGFKKVPEPRPS